ncbi:MAG: GNAT family N-acetyltransferase [Theionarchaea archaeon]|nr:GNAT family N-acetyltransferase [Theionarchaea archaeon]
MDRIYVSELQRDDLPFLFELWHIPEVMKYADEFPSFRKWSKSDDLDTAWTKYQENRRFLGNRYTQLVIRLTDGTNIGESFFVTLDRKFIGRWRIPECTCFAGDIKLLPRHWGQGLGTEGMREVVTFVFDKTDCDIFVVPPHKNNPAAKRVYEKAGFIPITGKKGNQMMWASHLLMNLTRERYSKLYKLDK